MHGLGALARDMDHAALVLHESNRAIGHEQGEWNPVQVFRLQRAAFQRLDPSLSHLLTQLGLVNPLNLRPQPCDRIAHALRPSLEELCGKTPGVVSFERARLPAVPQTLEIDVRRGLKPRPFKASSRQSGRSSASYSETI